MITNTARRAPAIDLDHALVAPGRWTVLTGGSRGTCEPGRFGGTKRTFAPGAIGNPSRTDGRAAVRPAGLTVSPTIIGPPGLIGSPTIVDPPGLTGTPTLIRPTTLAATIAQAAVLGRHSALPGNPAAVGDLASDRHRASPWNRRALRLARIPKRAFRSVWLWYLPTSLSGLRG